MSFTFQNTMRADVLLILIVASLGLTSAQIAGFPNIFPAFATGAAGQLLTAGAFALPFLASGGNFFGGGGGGGGGGGMMGGVRRVPFFIPPPPRPFIGRFPIHGNHMPFRFAGATRFHG